MYNLSDNFLSWHFPYKDRKSHWVGWCHLFHSGVFILQCHRFTFKDWLKKATNVQVGTNSTRKWCEWLWICMHSSSGSVSLFLALLWLFGHASKWLHVFHPQLLHLYNNIHATGEWKGTWGMEFFLRCKLVSWNERGLKRGTLPRKETPWSREGKGVERKAGCHLRMMSGSKKQEQGFWEFRGLLMCVITGLQSLTEQAEFGNFAKFKTLC